MSQTTQPRFTDIVDAADRLSLDEQESLLEILRKRIAEARRAEIVSEVEEAEQEFAEGNCAPASVTRIITSAQS